MAPDDDELHLDRPVSTMPRTLPAPAPCSRTS